LREVSVSKSQEARSSDMVRVFIGAGSNIDPEKNVIEAIKLLRVKTRVVAISTVYRTKPVTPTGSPDGPDYYNCVVEIDTDLNPDELRCSILKKIEHDLGRERKPDKYAPRTIDLDILIYDDLVVRGGDQRIPDPDIMTMPFLSIPIAELAPDLIMPDSGIGIAEVAKEHLINDMVALGEYTERIRSLKSGV
jgi:2-amino-4-hydroxy-6-hydroxymethyldihydropteridine diphosphokinase